MNNASVLNALSPQPPEERFSVVRPPLAEDAELLMRAEGLSKSYRKGKLEIPVLRNVDFHVRQSEFVSIVGKSGSGKSTLMHLLGVLDQPDAGEIHFGDRRIDNLSPRARDAFRNRDVGVIFQFYHLLPEFSTLENVLAPRMIGESLWGYFTRRKQHRQNAIALLERVGLGHRLDHRPSELSGGEMQRAAIARALISQPRLLLADEPTGNLDPQTGEEIFELLQSLNREQDLTIVMVSHDESLAERTDRVVRLTEVSAE